MLWILRQESCGSKTAAWTSARSMPARALAWTMPANIKISHGGFTSAETLMYHESAPIDMNPALEAKLKNIPSGPGVYIYKDSAGTAIYVGKSKSLRNRV